MIGALFVALAVALVGLATSNLAFGFGAGIGLYLLLRLAPTVRGLFSPVHQTDLGALMVSEKNEGGS